MVREAYLQRQPPPRRRVRTAGWLLGVSLAGLLDGIVLPAGGSGATLAGLAFWALALVAVATLWRARARFAEPAGGRVLAGSALAGAGAVDVAVALAWPGLAPTWRALLAGVSVLLVLVGARALASATKARRKVGARAGRGRVA
ncbi:MAG: putative rane protein [Thermoplasmata archaeon]|nr:putative rane protein [Thermoplasmata archaeon]